MAGLFKCRDDQPREQKCAPSPHHSPKHRPQKRLFLSLTHRRLYFLQCGVRLKDEKGSYGEEGEQGHGMVLDGPLSTILSNGNVYISYAAIQECHRSKESDSKVMRRLMVVVIHQWRSRQQMKLKSVFIPVLRRSRPHLDKHCRRIWIVLGKPSGTNWLRPSLLELYVRKQCIDD